MKKIPQLPVEQPSDESQIDDSTDKSVKGSTDPAAQMRSTASAAGTVSGGKMKKGVSRNQLKRNARQRVLQALYQWEFSGSDASAVRNEFLKEQDMSRVDVDYFTELYNGISKDPDAVDGAMQDALDRPIADLDPIERAVLRICVYELQNRLDIPLRVVINEGIEITKRFGADQGHKYINGVLDKLAERLRPHESRG